MNVIVKDFSWKPPRRRLRRAVAAIATFALAVPLLVPIRASAQTDRERAAAAYQTAQGAEVALKAQPSSERSRAAYLRVIRQYERVYLITPHTGYADDALLNIAALYEEINADSEAARTLQFLIREYPASRFIGAARADLARLTESGTPEVPPETGIADLREATPPPVPPESEAPRGPVSVENVRYWESQKSVRVVVDLTGDTTFTEGDAQNPPRYFVDIHDARLGASLRQRTFPVESVMLHNVRVGQYDPDTVRVVLDLVQFHNATIFTLRDPERLVIDVLGDAPPVRPADPSVTESAEPAGDPPPPEAAAGEEEAPTPVMPADTAAEPLAEQVSEPEIVVIGTPASPTTNGSHSLIRSLGLKVGRVVIDPGHGGRDTGTIGPSGLTEKELVLDLALRLKARIESEIGAEVVLTRSDDTFVPLETRTAIANQAEADLFVSIHANSSNVRSIRGFETYILNLATSNEDREVAARENAASQASISELQNLISKIMLQENVEESRELATHIQHAMAERHDLGRDRGVKQAPFVVLIGANMPSILAEVSFISNPDDERLLKGEDRRREIVEALFEGVRSYSNTLSGFRTAAVQP